MLATVRAVTVVGALLAAAACASKPAPAPAPAATPVATPVTPSWLTCPDPTDGPSIVINAIDEAHRAWTADPSTQLPPGCVFAAFARASAAASDSTNARALALATEADRRTPRQRDVLAAEVVLFARARRHADVSRTYDRLVALDSQPPMELAKLALAAAHERRDTTSLSRILSRTMNRPDAPSSMRTEYNVVRQTRQLWAAINEARGLLRQNPKYLVAYPSLVGNFGTLGLADSVVASVRRALAAGASRASISPSLETLVNAMLRHATLYGSAYDWQPVIARASRVDSTLSTPSTKFLVAALILYAAEPATAEISALVSSTGMTPSTDPASVQRRTAGCQRLPAVTASLNVAEARLREGGDRYAGGAAQVQAGLAAARSKVASLQDVCARAGV